MRLSSPLAGSVAARWRRAYARALSAGCAIAFLFLFAATRATAAVHPVPLDKNVTSEKCLECHEDKTKGKAVHTAMAGGCLSCHEVRTNRDITHIKLIQPTAVGLCVSCHADKKAADIKGTIHPPAVRDCLACHDPHHADEKNQLLKPLSGDAKTNLCLTCHQTGVNMTPGGSRHVALDGGCDTCHIIHKTGPEPTTENRFHLAKAAPALCLDCHDVKDEALIKAHNGQPFGASNCLECHDPHQSNQPKLMAQFVHAAMQGGCDTCHQPAKDGKVVLTQADPKSLCVTCHDEKAKQIDNAKFPHPGAAGDCTDCHSPHASRQPGLPKTDSVSICLGCHSDIDDLRKKSVHHQPAFEQGCTTCHAPHGGDHEHLLRAQGNALCLECHGPEAVPQRDEANHVLTLFNGQVRLPWDYYQKNKVPVLPLRFGLGHPVEYHPVSDVMDPTDQSKVKVPLSCLSCHQPHASLQAGLLVKDQADNLAFCDNCHKNRLNMQDTISPGK